MGMGTVYLGMEYIRELEQKYTNDEFLLKNKEQFCKSVGALAKERNSIIMDLSEMETDMQTNWRQSSSYFSDAICMYPDPYVVYSLKSEELIQLQRIIQYKNECLAARVSVAYNHHYDLSPTFQSIISLVKSRPNLSYDELIKESQGEHSLLEVEWLIEFDVIVRWGQLNKRFWKINKKTLFSYEEWQKNEAYHD